MMFTVKQMECEICKATLPDVVKYQDKMYEIYEFVKPNYKNWISIETLNTNPGLKTLYIINLDKKDTIKIGRSHDSDLRVTDISVSRFHAQINRQIDNTLRIEDNNSKFGSLVLVQINTLPIVVEPTLCLQIGRSIIFAHMKPPWRIFSCFSSCSGEIQKYVDYTKINTGHINIEKVLSVKIQIDKDDEDESLILSNKKEDLPEIREEIDNISNDNILTSNNENEDAAEEQDFIDNPNRVRNPEELNNLNLAESNAHNHNVFNTEINLNEAEILNSVRLISKGNLNNVNFTPEEAVHNKIRVGNLKMNHGEPQPLFRSNEEPTLVKITNSEKKFNTLNPVNKSDEILGGNIEIEKNKLNMRRSEIQKSTHLEKIINQRNCNDDSVLNLNCQINKQLPKKTKPSFSTHKINIDSFKRYEEDSNKQKNNELLSLALNSSPASRNINNQFDNHYKALRQKVSLILI
jgi:hypothetical protein